MLIYCFLAMFLSGLKVTDMTWITYDLLVMFCINLCLSFCFRDNNHTLVKTMNFSNLTCMWLPCW